MGKYSPGLRPGAAMVWLFGVAIIGAAVSGEAAGATTTVPAAPTITSVKAVGLNSITVAFAAPGDNGGTRIVSYRATCTSTDGGVAGAHNASHSPIRVPSLTGNDTYTCVVSANNAAGPGPASTSSLQVVVRPRAPAAPSITSVKAVQLRSVTVAFTSPADDGGAPITNYRATCISTTGGASHAREAYQSPITVTDLTAAQTYTCTVAADNRIGLGRSSVASTPVIARPTAPAAPSITSVNAIGQRSVEVSFTKPTNDGGAPIKNYLVACRSSDGGAARDRDAAGSPIRVAGLTSDKTYTCTVAASNGVRVGPASPPSKPFNPRSS
ncbi:MAG: fibronectin type III domain-containing protein [Acidimicrobiia bacterium]